MVEKVFSLIKNFLITGHGRSGTSYLAQLMNRSKKWTVRHEPKSPNPQRRLSRTYYGEVNSYLRWDAAKLKVDKKGVILRNPLDILLSALNWRKRHSKKRGKKTISRISISLHLIDELIELGAYKILFSEMTSDMDYVRKLLSDFAIDDVKITQKIIKTKVNTKKRKRYTSLPKDIKLNAEKRFDWFIEKYF